MEKQFIQQSDLLDILFDGRNKTYGAYELRKNYNRRITKAMAGTLFIVLLFIAGVLLAGKTSKETANQQLVTDISLESVEKPKEEVQLPPEKKEQPKLETVSVTPPKIVKDAEMTPEDEVKPVEDLEQVQISNFNMEGEKSNGIVAAPVEQSIAGVEAIKTGLEDETIFYTVQIAAAFPGGKEEWVKFLEKNLNSTIPLENGAPSGKYTVIISFIVSKDGSISDVVAENDPGWGTKAEAVRVIAKGPKWTPAVQNGRNVIYRHRQSITFMVSEE
ncbi:MAG: energy transducer TonB [Sediminibacterium sp.]|nr:energy transducer TonB [Sediminibacterium sp.]